MTKTFVFRTWAADRTHRLKELWWQGKSAAMCASILGVSSSRAIREKVEREGFTRNPELYSSGTALLPQPREDGSLVTISNVRKDECRWINGPATADAVMCGRRIVKGALCDVHFIKAHTKEGRLLV
jgi:hypothetical protein